MSAISDMYCSGIVTSSSTRDSHLSNGFPETLLRSLKEIPALELQFTNPPIPQSRFKMDTIPVYSDPTT